MRQSLRFQLLVPLVTLLLGVVAMSLWAAVSSAAYAREQINDQVRDIVDTLNRSSFPLTENVLHLLKGFSGADYLLVGRQGSRITTLEQQPPPLRPADDAGVNKPVRLEHHVELGGRGFLYTSVKLQHGRYRGSTLYIFYPESLWREAVWQAVRPSLIFGALAGLAAIVFTVVLAQRLTRRVRELERQTRLIAEGDFSPMPLPRRRDELRDLAQSVNKMAQRLAGFQETMRQSERLRLLGQVSGGMAHQLRNGVTGARLAVQLHARACPGGPEAEALTVALRQLALVELHLKRFLALGRDRGDEEMRSGGDEETTKSTNCAPRSQAGTQNSMALSLSPHLLISSSPHPLISLTRLLEDHLALLSPQCRHARVEVRWAPPAGVGTWLVPGSAEHLGQLFLNLLLNAIEAAGPAGNVEVTLVATGEDRVRVRISDSGVGPPPAVAGQLFEPFVTGKPAGVGLGLAVAQEIVQAHGGRLWWERAANRTDFIVELPCEAEGEVERNETRST
jgi:signal transduction histidine kinase